MVVTGGTGFIGRIFIRFLLRGAEVEVLSVDLITYAGNPDTFAEVADSRRYSSACGDIADTDSLSPGNADDAPEGRKLLETFENAGGDGVNVIMDKAYEGDETHQLVLDLEMIPVVPPKANRLTPCEYEVAMYTKWRCIRSETRS